MTADIDAVAQRSTPKFGSADADPTVPRAVRVPGLGDGRATADMRSRGAAAARSRLVRARCAGRTRKRFAPARSLTDADRSTAYPRSGVIESISRGSLADSRGPRIVVSSGLPAPPVEAEAPRSRTGAPRARRARPRTELAPSGVLPVGGYSPAYARQARQHRVGASRALPRAASIAADEHDQRQRPIPGAVAAGVHRPSRQEVVVALELCHRSSHGSRSSSSTITINRASLDLRSGARSARLDADVP